MHCYTILARTLYCLQETCSTFLSAFTATGQIHDSLLHCFIIKIRFTPATVTRIAHQVWCVFNRRFRDHVFCFFISYSDLTKLQQNQLLFPGENIKTNYLVFFFLFVLTRWTKRWKKANLKVCKKSLMLGLDIRLWGVNSPKKKTGKWECGRVLRFLEMREKVLPYVITVKSCQMHVWGLA